MEHIEKFLDWSIEPYGKLVSTFLLFAAAVRNKEYKFSEEDISKLDALLDGSPEMPLSLLEVLERFVNYSESQNLSKGNTNVDGLNPEQQRAFEKVVDWIENAEEHSPQYYGCILSGWAGTGKSFTTRAILKHLESKGYTAILTAPTNKAVKVCADMCPTASVGTIHSFLGVKPKTKEDRIYFVRDHKANKFKDIDGVPVSRVDFVILDECGMVGAELYSYIQDEMLENDTRFIFVGDPEQLNPVKEDVSPIWSTYDTQHLHTVVRHGSYILDLATYVRNLSTLRNLNIQTGNSGEEGVWKFNSQREFVNELKLRAKEGWFSSADQESKVVAWRNKVVDQYNSLIRKVIYEEQYGDDIPYFVRGDKLILTAPYSRHKDHPLGGTNYNTDEEADVTDVISSTDEVYGFRCFQLHVNRINTSGFVEQDIIEVVHPDDEHLFRGQLDAMANTAKSLSAEQNDFTNNKTPEQRRELSRKVKDLWAEFWELTAKYAYVKYAFAITAHRSQGSTYANVFVDAEDIIRNPNMEEARRCLYVAVTRASKRIFIYN